MNTNKCIAWTLRAGILAGIILIIIGEIIAEGNPFLWSGVLILIMSPFLGVIVAFAGLVAEKDWFWAGVSAMLLAIVGSGLTLAVL